jgi:hypothetical protein
VENARTKINEDLARKREQLLLVNEQIEARAGQRTVTLERKRSKLELEINNLSAQSGLVADPAKIKDVALDYIRRTVELANTTKRLAQLAIGYFVETVMARAIDGGDSSILEEILFQGSQSGHNGRIAFSRGVVSSIVFSRRED